MELRPDLWHCAECETAYAVGLTCCPQCSSTRRADAPEPAPLPPPGLPVRTANVTDDPEEM